MGVKNAPLIVFSSWQYHVLSVRQPFILLNTTEAKAAVDFHNAVGSVNLLIQIDNYAQLVPDYKKKAFASFRLLHHQ